MFLTTLVTATLSFQREGGLRELHLIAQQVVDSAKVRVDGEIPGVGKNATGFQLRLPGGTQNYYPAFWIRDAAMTLGSDFVSQHEVEGWIKLVASVQPGQKGIALPHNMFVPAYSIPDHITLKGEACWYPGAYADQGVGDYGLLPPADDAYYFVEMVHEQMRLAKNARFLSQRVKTPYGETTVLQAAEKAFDSVAVDVNTGLVLCDQKQTRVDWGFCDSVRKTGMALMPSLLRWQAARQLSEMTKTTRYRDICTKLTRSMISTFLFAIGPVESGLWSATGLGKQDDIWASAFAVSLGALTPQDSKRISRHLLRLYSEGQITMDGQVRHLPKGEFWAQASSGRETYQNGGYWATPTGWLIKALSTVDQKAGDNLFLEYITDLKLRRGKGAPFEWTNREKNQWVNPQYCSSVALVYTVLSSK